MKAKWNTGQRGAAQPVAPSSKGVSNKMSAGTKRAGSATIPDYEEKPKGVSGMIHAGTKRAGNARISDYGSGSQPGSGKPEGSQDCY